MNGKTGRRLLGLLLAVMLLLPACALADVSWDSEENTLRVACSQCVEGSAYSILLFKQGADPAAITAGDLLFVDQMTAGLDGRIEVVFIAPAFPACTAYAGGTFADNAASPRLLGTYDPAAVMGIAMNLPAALREIETEAFAGGSFTHVYLGEQVEKINARAFAECENLIYIYIPASTISIASDAFAGCSGFTIGCRLDSAAYRYAIDRGISYILITD